MGIFAKVLTNLSGGAARSLNDKYARKAAVANADSKGGDASGGCSPCKARALQYEVQKGLGLKKGWYAPPAGQ